MPEVVALAPKGHNQPQVARPEPINNTELVHQFRLDGGKIIHMRPRLISPGFWSRGMTVAFKPKGSRVEISTAVQHRHDTFTKKIGTKLAIEHFIAGKTIFLPSRKDYLVDDIKLALSVMC